MAFGVVTICLGVTRLFLYTVLVQYCFSNMKFAEVLFEAQIFSRLPVDETNFEKLIKDGEIRSIRRNYPEVA